MPTGRNSFCTAVAEGEIYAIGGLRVNDAAGAWVNVVSVEAYNPATDKWAKIDDGEHSF